jgi:hypothetical protein
VFNQTHWENLETVVLIQQDAVDGKAEVIELPSSQQRARGANGETND